MNKTKKNFFLKVAGLMAAVMMLTTCVVAGTMAKYTSTGNITGGTGVTAAKWSVKVGAGDQNDIAQAGFNINDLTWNIEAIESTSNVTDAFEPGKIAPGTWGYAEINIENASEVAAKITISCTLPTSSTTGLTFAIMDETPTSDNVAHNSALASTGFTLEKDGGDDTKTIYLAYK